MQCSRPVTEGDNTRELMVLSHSRRQAFCRLFRRRSMIVNQRFGITVKFLISADSPEEAEEIIESGCEKMASSIHEGDVSYEGIEDIEEEDE